MSRKGHGKYRTSAVTLREMLIYNKKHCVKFLITGYSSDCEQKNTTALEIMLSQKADESESLQSNIRLREGTADAVHVGKCLKGSLANWWLVVDDYHVNTSNFMYYSPRL